MLDRETVIAKLDEFNKAHGYTVIGHYSPLDIGHVGSPHLYGIPIQACTKIIAPSTREEFLSQGTESPEDCDMTHFYRVVCLPD